MQERVEIDTTGYPHHERSWMSTVLACSAEAIWAEIRDFNSYPAYIEGVTESLIEDDKPGDEVGCVRRFVYLGDVTRQTLTGHSDDERWFSHTGCEPLEWPSHQEGEVGPAVYENRIKVTPISDRDETFLEWSLEYWTATAQDAEAWKRYFDGQIPVWAGSLRRYMRSLESAGNAAVLITGLRLKAGVDPVDYERFALEVDKPTCEAELPSFESWNVHRVLRLQGSEAEPPYDYVEVVHLSDLDQFERDLQSPVVAELGRRSEPLLEEPDLIVTRLVE